MKYIVYSVILLAFGNPLSAQEIRRTPLVLSKGGTPEKPEVFDGKGLVIDLGVDITENDWAKEGEVWRSRGPIPDLPPIADEQRAGLFLDEVPLRISRTRPKGGESRFTKPEELEPGKMAWSEDGSVHFRWPPGKAPGSARIIRPPGQLQSCVVIACSHLTVRNIVAKHAANDGFNIHGDRVGIRLENVKALSNGDEGISAHETVQMDVFDSEIAWNASSAGGVADVNDSITTYTRCELHHNIGAAFLFDGVSHRVTDCLIHHQEKDIVIRGEGVKVEQSGVVWCRE